MCSDAWTGIGRVRSSRFDLQSDPSSDHSAHQDTPEKARIRRIRWKTVSFYYQVSLILPHLLQMRVPVQRPGRPSSGRTSHAVPPSVQCDAPTGKVEEKTSGRLPGTSLRRHSAGTPIRTDQMGRGGHAHLPYLQKVAGQGGLSKPFNLFSYFLNLQKAIRQAMKKNGETVAEVERPSDMYHKMIREAFAARVSSFQILCFLKKSNRKF